MKKKENAKVKQGKATVGKIINNAMKIFSKKGYSKTTTEDLSRGLPVTRGTLYHHFSGKKAIFMAVFEHLQSKINDIILEEISAIPDPWQRLIKGTYVFLKLSIDSKFERIVFIDAPSVLGWEDWRRIDAQYSTKSLRDLLEELRDGGVIKPMPLEALTHIIAGAVIDAAVWIAESQDRQRAFEEAQSIMNILLSGLLL